MCIPCWVYHWKEYLCPSGALAVSRGKGWVLSCHAKWSLCFWFENFPEPFMWFLAWPCQLQRKKYLWSSLKFPQAIQVSQGGVPNRKGGVTPGIHQRIQSTCQGMIFFPTVFLVKAKHPTHRRSGKITGWGLNGASARTFFSAVMSWETFTEEKGLPLLKKSLWGLPESWPLGTVIFEAEIMWAYLGGSERDRKDHVSQSLSEGKRRVYPQPGKAVLDRFGDLGTKIPVTLDFWFSVELFSWTFFYMILTRVINT